MTRDNRIDRVRCVGIISVLFIHCAGHVLNMGRTELPFSAWFAADIYNSLARAGVPLFFMVSGALLLGSGGGESAGVFFRRRVSRIAIPFVVWSIAYTVYDHSGPGHRPAVADFIGILAQPAHYHLWFLYSITGLYLVTPLLRLLIKGNDRWYVPVLWVITIPAFFALETFTTVRFNPNFTRILPVYVGFFAVGHLLRDVRLTRMQMVWCALLVTAGWTATALGTYHLDRIGFSGNKGYFDDYLSIPVVVMAVCGYLLLMNAGAPSPGGRRAAFIRHLSACCMGIYLVHPMILDLFNSAIMPAKINGMMLHPSIGIPATVVAVMVVSLGVVSVVRRIPGVRGVV